MTNSKDLLKVRKNNSRSVTNHQKDTETYNSEKRPIVNIPSNYSSLGRAVCGNISAYSPMFAQPEVNQVPPIGTNWNPKKGNEVAFPSNNNNLPKVNVNLIPENENKTTKPQSQRTYGNAPLNTRVNLAEINIQEEKRNNIENNQNKSVEEIDEGSFSKNRNTSVSKCWEGDSNLCDNLMAGSLGSTIVPRTNNCSAFNETFENFLGENTTSRLQNDERKFIGEHGQNNKNYDLPVSYGVLYEIMNNIFRMSSLGTQIAKNSSELESVKNKILKRKQSIENKRIPSLFYGTFLNNNFFKNW